MDDAIFEKIYGETARPLWAYIARVSGNRAAADDILQEAYMRFLRSPPRQATMSEARPYLYKIATNLIYDHFRRIGRESSSAAEIENLSEAASDHTGQDSEMMLFFAMLKRQERVLLWLAYVEGYEHSEIASIMKLSSMSVRVLLFRARRKLAGLLKGEIE